MTQGYLQMAAVNGKEVSEESKANMLSRIRKRTILYRFLLFMPFTLLCATVLASIERTPLTGRYELPQLLHARYTDRTLDGA